MQTPESSPLDIESLLDAPEAAETVKAMPVGQEAYINGSADSDDTWDTDEILDIPRPPQTNAVPPIPETAIKLEEVLSSPSADAESVRGIPIIESSETPEAPQPAWRAHSAPEILSGEVVDSGSPAETDDQGKAFGQDSYDFRKSTFVMVSPDRRKSRMVKIFLAVGLFFALCAVGWLGLSTLIRDWIKKPEVASNTPVAAVPAGGTGAAPALGAKPAETKAAAVPSIAAATTSASAAASAAPAASASAKTAQPTPSPKPTPPPATPKPAAQPQAGAAGHAVGSGDGSIALQFASYKSPGEAQQMAARLKAAGVDARVIKAELAGKGTWYRVQGGRFANEGEASKFAATLKAKGTVRDFIVTGYQVQ